MRGQCGDAQAIRSRMVLYSEQRWGTQPAASSAGCIFKNPEGISAGRLIDELGLKGSCVGGAMVSREHGNFIVNAGNATADDVLLLIERIRECAKTSRAMELLTEVQILGE